MTSLFAKCPCLRTRLKSDISEAISVQRAPLQAFRGEKSCALWSFVWVHIVDNHRPLEHGLALGE